MKHKPDTHIVAGEITVTQATLNSPEYDLAQRSDDFYHDQFKVFAPLHGSATITGTSYANWGAENNSSNVTVLDANVQDYLYDEKGQRIGVLMATADGLGHFTTDAENQKLAQVSKGYCEAIVAAFKANPNFDVAELPHLLVDFAVALNQEYEDNDCDTEQYRCSVAFTIVRPKPTHPQQLEAIMFNVGDCSIVVVDHNTKQVATIVSARQFGVKPPGEAHYTYSPKAFQDLAKLKQDESDTNPERYLYDDVALANWLKVERIDIQPDDLILQFSDGVLDDIRQQTHVIVAEPAEEDPNVVLQAPIQDCEPDQAFLNALIQEELTEDTEPTPVATIANKLVVTAVKHLQYRRREEAGLRLKTEFLAFCNTHKDEFPFPLNEDALNHHRFDLTFNTKQQYDAYTIQILLAFIRERDVALSMKLLQYIKLHYADISLNQKSALAFIRALGCPCGDDTTLAIMRVPNPKTEYMRTMLHNQLDRDMANGTITPAEQLTIFTPCHQEIHDNYTPQTSNHSLINGHSYNVGNHLKTWLRNHVIGFNVLSAGSFFSLLGFVGYLISIPLTRNESLGILPKLLSSTELFWAIIATATVVGIITMVLALVGIHKAAAYEQEYNCVDQWLNTHQEDESRYQHVNQLTPSVVDQEIELSGYSGKKDTLNGKFEENFDDSEDTLGKAKSVVTDGLTGTDGFSPPYEQDATTSSTISTSTQVSLNSTANAPLGTPETLETNNNSIGM